MAVPLPAITAQTFRATSAQHAANQLTGAPLPPATVANRAAIEARYLGMKAARAGPIPPGVTHREHWAFTPAEWQALLQMQDEAGDMSGWVLHKCDPPALVSPSLRSNPRGGSPIDCDM